MTGMNSGPQGLDTSALPMCVKPQSALGRLF